MIRSMFTPMYSMPMGTLLEMFTEPMFQTVTKELLSLTVEKAMMKSGPLTLNPNLK